MKSFPRQRIAPPRRSDVQPHGNPDESSVSGARPRLKAAEKPVEMEDFQFPEFPVVAASGILERFAPRSEHELHDELDRLHAELMSRDDHIDALEREIDSLRANMQTLEQALAARKAALAALQTQNAKPTADVPSAPEPQPAPGARPASNQHEPVPAQAVESLPAPRAHTVATAAGEYPLLHEIHVTTETPDATPVDSSRGADRRSAGRVACALQIEFTEEAHFFAGLTQDISEGGLFVATYRLLPIGTPVSFGFDLPGGAHIEGRGEVRWVRTGAHGEQRPGIGIAFTELAAESVRAIAAFCAERPPLYIEM